MLSWVASTCRGNSSEFQRHVFFIKEIKKKHEDWRLTKLLPSKHTTSQKRRYNVAATSRRCSDVVATLCVCWVDCALIGVCAVILSNTVLLSIRGVHVSMHYSQLFCNTVCKRNHLATLTLFDGSKVAKVKKSQANLNDTLQAIKFQKVHTSNLLQLKLKRNLLHGNLIWGKT